ARLGDDAALPTDDALIAELRGAMDDDPAHGARGRSAPARLSRVLERGRALGVPLPELETISS
ncbi:MAG: hypothetical protein GXP55_11855, partial [Deltaproteobacteria bacterium]|nr:hypothetical protein [Deltaproteobacteria bacterium]